MSREYVTVDCLALDNLGDALNLARRTAKNLGQSVKVQVWSHWPVRGYGGFQCPPRPGEDRISALLLEEYTVRADGVVLDKQGNYVHHKKTP